MSSRVGDRRGGVQDAHRLCPPFSASCPFRVVHHSVSGPRHIGRIHLEGRVGRVTGSWRSSGKVTRGGRDEPECVEFAPSRVRKQLAQLADGFSVQLAHARLAHFEYAGDFAIGEILDVMQ